MNATEWIAAAGVVFGLAASLLAATAKSRKSKLETSVATAAAIAKSKVDETAEVLDAWKEVSRNKDIEIVALKTELKDERTHHQQCSREKARMEGQLAVMLQAGGSMPTQTVQPKSMHMDSVTVDKVLVADTKNGDDDEKE